MNQELLLWPSKHLSDRAHSLLIQVLKQPEFRARKIPWYEHWLMIGLNAFGRFAAFIFEHMVLRLALGAIALAIVTAALLYVLRIVRRGHVNEAEVPATWPDHERIGPGDFRRQAEKAVADSDYRTALRFLYLSFLAELQADKLLSNRSDFTNWEYIAQLREQSRYELIEKAEALTKVFEQKWYGHRPVSRDDYDRFSLECQL